MKWSNACEVVRRRAKTITSTLLSIDSFPTCIVFCEGKNSFKRNHYKCVHRYAHTRTHTHTHAHIRTHTHTHAHTQTFMQVRTPRRHTPSSMRRGRLVFCKLSVRGSSYCGTLRMLFLDWGEWTECTEPCQTPTATGTQYRRRFCFHTGRNKSCGKFQGVCNVKPCDGKYWQLNM